MVIIATSILAADVGNLAEAVRIAENSGADWIHLDIMDGHFVPNLTYGPPVVRALRPITKLPFDAHLMVTNPDDLIPELLGIGCEFVSIHLETCFHPHRTLKRIRDEGSKAGVAINPGTPVEMLMDLLPVMDYAVIMAVNPGFAGQKHIPESVAKVARFIKMAREQEWSGHVQVDGGAELGNIGSLVLAGADVIVAGASAFRKRTQEQAGWDQNFAKQVMLNIEELRAACDAAFEGRGDPVK